LELFGQVVPPVVVAQSVRWKEIAGAAVASPGARQNMIRLPRAADHAATDVTTATRLLKDGLPFRRSKILLRGLPLLLSSTSLVPKFEETRR